MLACIYNIKYFETSAVLITVIILGKYMESFTRGATASAIHALASKKVFQLLFFF